MLIPKVLLKVFDTSVYCAGVISIVEPLDYERAHNYILTVVATDLGVPPLSTQATVNITVTDSNDNPPIFTQLSYNAQVKEHTQIGDVVLHVSDLFYNYTYTSSYSYST